MEKHIYFRIEISRLALLASLLALSSTGCELKLISAPSARTEDSHINPAIKVTFSSPAPGSWVNNSAVSSFTFTGTCTEEGEDVILESIPVGIYTIVTCTNHSWTAILDLSPLGDGAIAISATQKDKSGYVNPETELPLDKLVVIPTVTFTTPTVASYANAATSGSFSVSGTCSANGQNVVLSGDASAIVPCTGGAWSTNLDLSAVLDGAVTLRANITDIAGNTAAQASVAFSKDVLPPGAFSISGVSGASDVTADAFLMDGAQPTANWAAAAGASSYDVTIYQNNGTTVQCPTQNVSAAFLDFTGCSLSFKQTYKVKVLARDAAGNSLAATNDAYAFYVDHTPVASADALVIGQDTSNILLAVLANDTDADSDVLSIASLNTTGTQGSATISGTNVNYTPPAGFSGTDTFSYRADDGHGGISNSVTVTLTVKSPFLWTGALSSNWSTSGNWCGAIVAGACAGGPAPDATQIAVFDGSCAVGHCASLIDAPISVKGILVRSTYTSTITQGLGNTVSIGASGYSQAAGTFAGSDSSISLGIGSTFSLSGGTFTMPAANVTTLGDWSITGGTLNTSGSSLILGNAASNLTQSITPGSATYGAVSFQGYASIYNLNGGTLKVGGTLVLHDEYAEYAGVINNGTIMSYGDISIPNKGMAGGSAVVVVAGNASGQTITGVNETSYMPSIQIAAGTNAVTLSGTIGSAKDWTYTSAGSLTLTGSTLILGHTWYNTHNIYPGTITYNNVTFAGWGGNFNFHGTTLNVGGHLVLADSDGSGQINNGTLVAYGDVSTANKGMGYGNAPVVVAGNATGQTITGISGAPFPAMQIAAGANAITLSGTIVLVKDWTLVSAGSLASAGSTLVFGNGGATLVQNFTPGAFTYANIQMTGWGSVYNLAGTALDISGDLSINDGYFNSGNFRMNGLNFTAGSVTLNGNKITKGGGTLTVGGVAQGTGSILGGTVDP